MKYDELQTAIWDLYNNFYSALYADDGTSPIAIYVKYTCYMSHAIGLAFELGGITRDEYEEVSKNYGYISEEMLEAVRLMKEGY